jgi:DNA-binding response OmpR family regulator
LSAVDTRQRSLGTLPICCYLLLYRFFNRRRKKSSAEGVHTMSRILVVEDSPTILYLMADALVQGGYEVLKATDGTEALRIATEEKPSLVLLDVILPKLNGYQVCRRLKAAPETAGIPVVMITSKSKRTDRHWGLEQGADDYVVKPFETRELLNVIARFVSRNK